MAGKLTGLAQLFDPGLELSGVPPQTAKTYRVPLPSAEFGLWCRTVGSAGAMAALAATPEAMAEAQARFEQLPNMAGDDLTAALLGDAYAEMIADGVQFPYIEFCGMTAYVWVLGGCGEQGEEMARGFWESGGHPEAARPANRATRRAAARGKTSTAEAATTKPAASTSGTRSRRPSSASGKPKPAAKRARASAGSTSSNAGTP